MMASSKPTPSPHDSDLDAEAVDVVHAPEQESGVSAANDPSPHDARVSELMSHTIDVPELASVVQRQAAADAADTLERLEEEEEGASEILHEMEDMSAAQALSEMEPALAEGLMEDLLDEDAAYAGHLVELMADDDAADLLQSLDPDDQRRLLAAMDVKPARELRALIQYDPESAGGIMTTDLLTIGSRMTIKQAIKSLRGREVSDHIREALVLDQDERLVGIVALHRLLLADSNGLVESIMSGTVRVVPPDMDREHVAREFDRYDHAMLPVVDSTEHLLGIVTVDDVIDIIRAEHTEDVQKTVGAGAAEAVYSGVLEKFRGRFPWLLISLVMMIPAAIIVLSFEQVIADAPVLAVLMPVIAAVVGNAGHQALAVTQRGIVLGEVRRERVSPLLLREMWTGLLNGFALGVIICLLVGLLSARAGSSASWPLGFVTGLGTMLTMGVGTLFGSGIPLLMKRLGFDPAQSSAIFLIMITDAISFGTILSLSLLIFERVQMAGII